jgi:hypothetical protein
MLAKSGAGAGRAALPAPAPDFDCEWREMDAVMPTESSNMGA